MNLSLLTTADGDALFRVVDDARADLIQWFEWPDKITSPETATIYIGDIERCSRIRLFWLIYDNGWPVGGVQMRLRDGGSSVSLPYWLIPSARGKGLASEALTRVLRIAHKIGFRKAHFKIALDNTASQHVAQRLHFSPLPEMPIDTPFRGGIQTSQSWELLL